MASGYQDLEAPGVVETLEDNGDLSKTCSATAAGGKGTRVEIETASFQQDIARGGSSNLEARQSIGNIDSSEAIRA